jgi:membrane-bound lytic murein transglycosylase D
VKKFIFILSVLVLLSLQSWAEQPAPLPEEEAKQAYSRALASLTPEQKLWGPPVYGEQKALGYDAYSFSVPKNLENEVQFWIKIYTKYTTHQGLFHVAGQTDQILGELDLTALHKNPQWGPFKREREVKKLIDQERKKLAAKHRLPEKRVRFQGGLSDRMREAVAISGQYLPMMEEVFRKDNLPIELTRLVFVESSFNVEARSRVGASGLWQIMPILGKKFNYLQSSFDKRDHPYYATKLAAKILKQNYNILKNWPLAVTSYNFGVGSMLKVKKKLKTQDVETIFGGDVENPYMGFASRNFYATFLAAMHVEAHANIYFGDPLVQRKPVELTNIYLTKDIKFKDLLETHKIDRQRFAELNPHIRSSFLKPERKVPKGTLITLPMQSKLATESDPAI